VPDDDEDDLARGVHNLLAHLERTLQPSESVRKGESMEAVFARSDFHRHRGEPVREFITRFDLGLAEMRENGIDIEVIPDLAGWWFVRFLSLNEERRERITSALPDEHMALNDVKKLCMRIFSDLHIQELAEDALSLHAQSRPRGPAVVQQPVKPRPAFATAHDDEDDDGASCMDSAEFQNACRHELECLSLALEANGGDFPSHMTSDEVATVTDAANSLAIASEAMSTLRSARSVLCIEQKKGKGKGKADGPAIAPFLPRRGGRSRGNHYAPLQQSIAQRKLRSHCNSCGGIGHWSGDSECPAISSDANGPSFTDSF